MKTVRHDLSMCRVLIFYQFNKDVLCLNVNERLSEMKKTLLSLCCIISLSACASHHQGTADMSFKSTVVIAEPMEVEVIPNEQVTASAQCSSFLFGLFDFEPSNRAFGPELVEEKGNFAPPACTQGALFKAMQSAKADTILMPRYSTEGAKFLCIPFTDLCFFNQSKVTIKGVAGKYSKIKKITDEETARTIKIQKASEKKIEVKPFTIIPF